jgi:hypothetical protein
MPDFFHRLHEIILELFLTASFIIACYKILKHEWSSGSRSKKRTSKTTHLRSIKKVEGRDV